MVELIAFLRARTEDDRQAADKIHHGECNSVPGTWDDGGTCDCRWPSHVLAEVEAKRQIIDAWEENLAVVEAETDFETSQYAADAASGLEIAVRALAAVYAAHPDFLDEWKPLEPF